MRFKKVKRRKYTLGDQIKAGEGAIYLWGEKASDEDVNNGVLASMAVALIHTIQSTGPGRIEDLNMAIGYAMLAAYLYGQHIGGNVVHVESVVALCPTCSAIASDDSEFKPAVKESGVWVHHGPDDAWEQCWAHKLWDLVENDNAPNQLKT